MKFLNWRKDSEAQEVKEAEETQSALFTRADKVLGEVRRIRKAADAIEDYAEVEKARLHRKPA